MSDYVNLPNIKFTMWLSSPISIQDTEEIGTKVSATAHEYGLMQKIFALPS